MKLIVLVNSNIDSFNKMVELINKKEIYIINTEHCDANHEYNYLLDSIKEFSRSSNEVMLGKFSGRETIIKELGDERPEMIVTLSSNKNSRHYSENPVETFLHTIVAFEKETILA